MDKKITIEELKKILKDKEEERFNFPLRKRLLLVYDNFRSSWSLRKFYKPFWFISEARDAISIIFKIPMVREKDNTDK